MKEQFQVVTLVLTDGREIHFLGKAQVLPEQGAAVREVRITPPRDFPDGVSWKALNISWDVLEEK